MTKVRGLARARGGGRFVGPEVALRSLGPAGWRSAVCHGQQGEQLLLGDTKGEVFSSNQVRTTRPRVSRDGGHDESALGPDAPGQVQESAAHDRAEVNARRGVGDRLPPADPPMLLTVAQVEAALQLGRTRTYELLRSGEIPVRRVGRLIRVSRLALEEWVAQSSEPSRQS
jgi:excisionase family DNA binding protein